MHLQRRGATGQSGSLDNNSVLLSHVHRSRYAFSRFDSTPTISQPGEYLTSMLLTTLKRPRSTAPASRLCDDLDFVRVEAEQLRILNQVVRMAIVPLMINRAAYIV